LLIIQLVLAGVI